MEFFPTIFTMNQEKRISEPKRRIYHSVVCVACRHYCCLSCVVSRFFMLNSEYKIIIDCYQTRQQSVIRWRKKSCAKYNKISIDGQLRQKKSWVKEKVNLKLSYDSLPRSNEDSYRLNVKNFWSGTFTLSKTFAIQTQLPVTKSRTFRFYYFNEKAYVTNGFCAVGRNRALISGSVHFKVRCASRLLRRKTEGILNSWAVV